MSLHIDCIADFVFLETRASVFIGGSCILLIERAASCGRCERVSPLNALAAELQSSSAVPFMEKYSHFNDPFTGINPFISPPPKKLSLCGVVVALLRLPLVVLMHLGVNTLPLLISIKGRRQRLRGVVACNSSSVFDRYVVRAVLGRVPLFHLREDGFLSESGRHVQSLPDNAVVFVEGCSSNNRSILQFVRPIRVDYVLGLRYNPECIYMYGSYWRFLLGFLATKNHVKADVMKTSSASKLTCVTGLQQVALGVADKKRFMELVMHGTRRLPNMPPM